MLAPLFLLLSVSVAAPVSLLPDGLLVSGQGLSANLEVGATRETGHGSPLGHLGARGAFAYHPDWQGEAILEVQATQPADSMVLSRSRLGVILSTFNREPGMPLGILTMELEWWDQRFHLDTGTKAIDVLHSGLEGHLGMGLGGIGGRSLQGALGTSAGMRIAASGPERTRPEFVLRAKATACWSLQDLLVHTTAFSQGLGVYLTLPVQWNPFPIDPAAGTGRPYALPRWEYGIRLGLTGLL